MSSNIKAGFVAVVAILLVFAVVVVGGDSSEENNQDSATVNSQTADDDTTQTRTPENPFGVDSFTTDPPYRITTSVKSVGFSSSGTIEYDENGNIRSTSTTAGQKSEFVIIENTIYAFDSVSGEWTASDVINGDTGIGLGEDEFEDLSAGTITDKGLGDCTSGTCRIYEISDVGDDEDAVVKVDEQNNRFSDLEITEVNGDVSTVIFEYDVLIEPIVAPL